MIRSHLRFPIALMRLMAPMVRIEQTPSWFGVKSYFHLYDIGIWWDELESNQRRQPFQGCATTNWAIVPYGTRRRTRTLNTCVRSAMLFQLSYAGFFYIDTIYLYVWKPWPFVVGLVLKEKDFVLPAFLKSSIIILYKLPLPSTQNK